MQSTKSTAQFFNHIPFQLPSRYQGIKLLGAGSYGHVLQANDKKLNIKVAIKKLHAIEDIIDAKRALREIRLLRTLQHENIVRLTNALYDTNDTEEMGTIYLVQDYFPADLYKVVRNKNELTDDHVQYIMYQLVKGLYYMHSANIMHRDIKPSNILASEECQVCFCDFGLARKMEEQDEVDNSNSVKFTEYVVTRYYRAPEVMVSSSIYALPLDIWSLGCTFAELLNGGHVKSQILFKGQSYIQMVKMIFETLGKPSDEDLKQFITNGNAREFVDSIQTKPKTSISQLIKYPNPKALNLLDKMLEINPFKRITAKECLSHPYFEDIREPSEEIVPNEIPEFDFEHDEKLKIEQVRQMILEEINYFKKQNQEQLIDVPTELKRLAIVHEQNKIKRLKQGKK